MRGRGGEGGGGVNNRQQFNKLRVYTYLGRYLTITICYYLVTGIWQLKLTKILWTKTKKL